MLKVAPAPVARIVPKNLLISAMRALDNKVVRDNDVRESNLRDLCTLITMSILYDTLETLGNESELNPSRKPHIAEEYATIFRITELNIVPGPRPEELEAVLERAAPAAAMLPFRAGRPVDQAQVRSQLMGALRESTSDTPDYWSDFAEGERLLATRDGGNATNSERFVLRSFLYVGLAQLRARPLVPDTARSRGALSTTARTSYGALLEEAVNEKYEQRAPQVSGSPIPLPPFAETALARCGSKRAALPEVLRELREQLKAVRLTLAALEAESELGNRNGVATLFGTLLAGGSAVARDERFYEALGSLRRARFALPPGLCVVAPVFEVIKAAIEILTTRIQHPLSVFGLMVNARDLLTGGRELQQLPERSTFMEIHHQLGSRWWQSPSSFRELFGDVRPDEA